MTLEPEQAGRDRLNLANALRDLRRAVGLTGQQLARRTGMSQSKLSRIETGRRLPSVDDVHRLLRALGVDEATRAELLDLARVANAEYQDVRADVQRGLHHTQLDLAALETDTTHMRHFLPTMPTGLLQVPEYMRAAMDTPVEPAAGDTTAAITVKLKRQEILHDTTKQFAFLFTESAVRWQLCEPSVMALQVDRLVSLSWMSHIHIGVLPLSAHVAQGAYHTFVVYDRRLVTAELFTGALALRDPKDIDHYLRLFDFFSNHALWAEDARGLLASISNSFRSHE